MPHDCIVICGNYALILFLSVTILMGEYVVCYLYLCVYFVLSWLMPSVGD